MHIDTNLGPLINRELIILTNNDSTINLEPLNAILHQPIRTNLVAFLMTRGNTTFNELKTTLNVIDGNLDSHIKRLLAEKCIHSEKITGIGRPQTYYSLTKGGI